MQQASASVQNTWYQPKTHAFAKMELCIYVGREGIHSSIPANRIIGSLKNFFMLWNIRLLV
tara:strand:- start:382 stop:564 length:183 start_codon:yes stop_codon:yes gene_type:complete